MQVFKKVSPLLFAILAIFLAENPGWAQTTTTQTTTTTHSDGTTTKTVEETTTATEPKPAAETAAPVAVPRRKLVGPTGVTGTIRRADRRQDRRD